MQFGGGSRPFVHVDHAFALGREAAQVLPFDGWQVDCVDAFLVFSGAASSGSSEEWSRRANDRGQGLGTRVRIWLTFPGPALLSCLLSESHGITDQAVACRRHRHTT